MSKFDKTYKNLIEQYGSDESPVKVGDIIDIHDEKQIVIGVNEDEVYTIVITDERNSFSISELNSMSFTHEGSILD